MLGKSINVLIVKCCVSKTFWRLESHLHAPFACARLSSACEAGGAGAGSGGEAVVGYVGGASRSEGICTAGDAKDAMVVL
jgi:hypothetical protein